MARVIPKEVQRQLDGITSMVAHAERLYRQGILSSDELEHARTYAVEQRFGPLMDAETYIAARQSGDFEKYEAIMNDSRSGTAAQREMAARKVGAHKIAEDALSINFQNEADQKRVMAETRKKMSEFVDMSGADPDDDFAVFEAKALIDLGDKVEKPKEEPSWSKPVQKIEVDDAHARDFKLRMEGTKGSKEWNDSHDAQGVKRASDGRIISERTLRADADKPKPRKSEYDDTRGYTVDKEFGVQSAADAAEIERFETDRHNDAVAAVEANPPTYVEPGPVTLPNSIE
jgi:hypothetical protein